MRMEFFSSKQQAEWDSGKLDRQLEKIVIWAQEQVLPDWSFLVTCILRSEGEDHALKGTGVHTVWRAIDIRTQGQDPGVVDLITRRINAHWTYDSKRPRLPVAYSKPHGTGPHLHIQTHPRTVAVPEVSA